MDYLPLLEEPDAAPATEAETTPASLPLVPVTLGRAHWKRLRHYWNGRVRGSAGTADGTDLELVGMGYIERRENLSYGAWFRITPNGELALAAQHQLEIAARKPHHELGSRLAEWLRSNGRITWENIECRIEEAQLPALAAAAGVDPTTVSRYVRPDVYSMAATKVEKDFNPAVHEVKVSRADFLSDIAKPNKRLAYATFAEVIYYVLPAGLIKTDEVPATCGLLEECAPGESEVRLKSKRRPVKLNNWHMMNLVLKPGRFHPLV
jgi:hypothetical protein